ncbi:MAG: hypothetical protein Q8Q25_02570 [bacterium]|nr:hypothetical protein [bacterium]
MKKLFIFTLWGALLLSYCSYGAEISEKKENRVPAVGWVETLRKWDAQIKNARDTINSTRKSIGIIEQFTRERFGIYIYNEYEKIKKELKGPLIQLFDEFDKKISGDPLAEPLENTIETTHKKLIAAIQEGRESYGYSYKHVALFWAKQIFYFMSLQKDEKILDLLYKKGQDAYSLRSFTLQKKYEKLLRKSASVINRDAGTIAKQERDFLSKRLPKIENQQKKLFNIIDPDENIDPIRIGLAFSGGGYRAMTLTAGFMVKLEELGILQSSLYVASLSGSTWYLAPWIFTKKSAAEYKNDLKNTISKSDADISAQMLQEFKKEVPNIPSNFLYDAIIPKFLFKIPLSSVDLYGAFLAKALLKPVDKNYHHALSLGMQMSSISEGNTPFPIYTAVSENTLLNQYQWYEFNPFEVENLNFGLTIPSWAFGRKFDKGKSTEPQFPQELSLGYLMGIFGSAYAIDVLGEIDQQHIRIAPWIKNITCWAAPYICPEIGRAVETGRFYPAFVYNPWKGLQLGEKEEEFTIIGPENELTREDKFTFVDAGISFNIPLLPLLKSERDLDVIIVGDASPGSPVQMEDGVIYPGEIAKFIVYIKKLWGVSYVKNKKIQQLDIFIPDIKSAKRTTPFNINRLPVIVYFGFGERPAGCLFDPNEPKNQAFWNTFNFKYTQENFNALSDFGSCLIDTRKIALQTILAWAYKERLWLKDPKNKPRYEVLEKMLEKIPLPGVKISEVELKEIQNKFMPEFIKTNNIFTLFSDMWENNLYQDMTNYAKSKGITAEALFLKSINPSDTMEPGRYLPPRGKTTREDIARYVLGIRKGTLGGIGQMAQAEYTWHNQKVILRAYQKQQNKIEGAREKFVGISEKDNFDRALKVIEHAKNVLINASKQNRSE